MEKLQYDEMKKTWYQIARYQEKPMDVNFELEIHNWQKAGLLKSSIFKSSIATIEKEFVISKLGRLDEEDSKKLEKMIEVIC